MKHFLYVTLDFNGTSWVVDQGTKKVDLNRLLADGWRPVRESPFSGSQAMTPYILILLERDQP